jgi:hypothetical protein
MTVLVRTYTGEVLVMPATGPTQPARTRQCAKGEIRLHECQLLDHLMDARVHLADTTG